MKREESKIAGAMVALFTVAIFVMILSAAAAMLRIALDLWIP